MSDDGEQGAKAPQPDHIRFLFDPDTALMALAGQRRRFGATVAELSTEELEAPSRCVGWTVADVLRHGVWADGAMQRIWSGDLSLVEGFDPRTTPDAAVRADRAVPDDEIRRRYLTSTETMIVELESTDPERLGRPSLSPAGPVPWWLSAVHLGWDSTIHERDVLAPLDRAVEATADETTVALAYSLVLVTFFSGRDPLDVQIGTVRLHCGDGPVTASTIGAAISADGGDHRSADDVVTVLEGDPVAIVDALSGRLSPADVLHGDTALIGRLGGLARYFTSSPAPT